MQSYFFCQKNPKNPFYVTKFFSQEFLNWTLTVQIILSIVFHNPSRMTN